MCAGAGSGLSPRVRGLLPPVRPAGGVSKRGQPWLGVWARGMWRCGAGGGSRCFSPRLLRACLRVGPAPAAVEAPPPGSQQPVAAGRLSPPFPRRSALCRRCLDRRRSFLLGNKKCLFSTEGWIRASSADGRERFHPLSRPLEQRLMFTVRGNSEACFQSPRLPRPREQAAARKSLRHPSQSRWDSYKCTRFVCERTFIVRFNWNF